MSNKSKRPRYGNPAKRRMLSGDLQKLVQPTGIANPRNLGGSISLFGNPREQSTSLLDMTDSVHLEATTVCTVDVVRSGELNEQAIFMTMEGRINKKPDKVSVGFIFGPDGAAAIITELLSLVDRFGAELLYDVTTRLTKLHQDKNVDLYFLKAAIDLVLEGENNGSSSSSN